MKSALRAERLAR